MKNLNFSPALGRKRGLGRHVFFGCSLNMSENFTHGRGRNVTSFLKHALSVDY